TPYGSVGTILERDSTEVVWVCKQDEDIDPGWFSQPDTDVLCVVAGQLRVESKAEPSAALTLQPGDVLVLPPDTACRAYRFPRDSKQATMFLAVTARSRRAGGQRAVSIPRWRPCPGGRAQLTERQPGPRSAVSQRSGRR